MIGRPGFERPGTGNVPTELPEERRPAVAQPVSTDPDERHRQEARTKMSWQDRKLYDLKQQAEELGIGARPLVGGTPLTREEIDESKEAEIVWLEKEILRQTELIPVPTDALKDTSIIPVKSKTWEPWKGLGPPGSRGTVPPGYVATTRRSIQEQSPINYGVIYETAIL